VITHRPRRPARTFARVATTTAVLGLLSLAAPALADTPSAWAKPPHTSGLDFLLVLILIPLGLALLITLLTMLPSLRSGNVYEPGAPWRSDNEWFGGPRKGLDATDRPALPVGSTSGKGGASAEW
jgi:hypothetical protein